MSEHDDVFEQCEKAEARIEDLEAVAKELWEALASTTEDPGAAFLGEEFRRQQAAEVRDKYRERFQQ